MNIPTYIIKDQAEMHNIYSQLVQSQEMRGKAKALADRLDLIHADRQYQAVWTHWFTHYGQYAGPQYVQEFQDLKAALAIQPTPNLYAQLTSDLQAAKQRVEELTLDWCEECHFPLSQCGPQGVDGEPSLDCKGCQLRERIDELEEKLVSENTTSASLHQYSKEQTARVAVLEAKLREAEKELADIKKGASKGFEPGDVEAIADQHGYELIPEHPGALAGIDAKPLNETQPDVS